MFKTILCCLLWAGCFIDSIYGMGGSMIEDGIWEVKSVTECENPEQYDYSVSVEQRKLNRTHDYFNAWLNFKKILNEDFGIKIQICKWVDGGCKDYTIMSDENIVEFLLKVAEDNTKEAFNLMGIKDFPVQSGEYEAEGYLIDYCEFPCSSVVGKFDALIHLLDKEGNAKGCILATIEFREPGDGEELCAKCQ